MPIQVGDSAPAFALVSDSGETVSLSVLAGKKIILYFYPKDLTPGCTQQACDFSEAHEILGQKNCVVFGVSKDSLKTHQTFKARYHLPYSLLVDTLGETCKAYDVIHEKKSFGKTYQGIVRSTFLIDEQGFVSHIFRNVKVKNHINQLLATISETNHVKQA